MLEIFSYTKTTSIGKNDYVLETYEELTDLKPIFIPKIEGDWLIAIVNPSIVDAKIILEDTTLPNFLTIKS